MNITPDKLYDYCKKYTTDQGQTLQKLVESSALTGQLKMISGPYLGRYLSLISKIIQPEYILEIGTFTGYGTVCLTEGLTESGKIITIEKNPEYHDSASKYFKTLEIHDKIISILGDADGIIQNLDFTFDLVFIDAAKRKYIDHYELVLPKLKKGGIILADNVLWKGTITSEDLDKLGRGLDEFNRHVAKDDRVENIILPIDDGIHMIRKK